MQLTMDTEAPIDIEFKMSTIKEEALNEIITNTVIESFSNNVTDSEDIVKDVASKLVSSNDELQNFQFNNKIEQDDSTTTTTESEEVENNTSEETSVDDCENKSLSPTSNTHEINQTDDIVNNIAKNNTSAETTEDDCESKGLSPASNTHEINQTDDIDNNIAKNNTSEETSIDDCESKGLSPARNTHEMNQTEDIDNNTTKNNTCKETTEDDCESKGLSPASNTHEINPTEDIVNNIKKNNTSEETAVDDCESKGLTPASNTLEINQTEGIVNNMTITQHQKLESQNNLNKHILQEKENVNKTETNDILDDINKQKSNSMISDSKLNDDCNNTKDLEDTTNDCKTDKKVNDKGKIVNDVEKNDIKQTNNDTKNLDIESSDTHSVINEVFNETDKKNKQSFEEVNQYQCENIVPPMSSKINNNPNKSEKTDYEVDLTFKNTPKDDTSIKEKEKTEEGVATADTKNGTIEILEEEKTDQTKNLSEVIREKVNSKEGEIKPKSSLISKLSNILDILSDDEEESHEETPHVEKSNIDKQCISLVDDDDVMLIDEDTSVKENTNSMNADKVIPETCAETTPNQRKKDQEEVKELAAKHEAESDEAVPTLENNKLDIKTSDEGKSENISTKPLLPLNFLNTCKKKLTDMTREDLEDFCSLKIVESIMDRSNLGDLKTQLKTMTITIEEFQKKTTLLAKQNKDLQLVLKSIQEEQKKGSGTPVIPLKITRSVGMQVLMTDRVNAKRKNAQIINSSVMPNQPLPIDKSNRNTSVQKVQKTKNQQIPVPRLVPAANTVNKTSTTAATSITDPGKSPQLPPVVNGIRNTPPTQKPEKRTRLQSVTVDLTDDEPPLKVTARSSPAPGVRLVPAQNLLPPQRPQFAPTMSSPRKVYIPISGPQSQNVRPGQTVVLKPVPPNPAPRPRMPSNNNVNKMQSNTIRMNRALPPSRHPAPLPDAVKQYQPTSWKALPPAPDLKLSKVDNGIVISWKIDGYQEDSYEDIISYQLFAYQETNSPPSTALWKKIGDVKALPLPMACTLTQFLAGYKYYFAVRAVDIKSRFGPFSLPASILLLNKM